MNRCALCIRMLQLLRARGRMQINEIARELETNPRNIREFKKELETAGYVIRQFTGKYGGYQLDEEVLFPSLALQPTEIQAIQEAGSYLKSHADFIHSTAFMSAFDKIMSNCSMKAQGAGVYISSQVPGLSQKEQQFVNRCIQAIQNCCCVSMSYRPLHDKEPYTTLIQPYELLYYQGACYCLAYSLRAHDFRSFRFSEQRMYSFDLTNQAFKRDSGFSLEKYVGKSGLIKGNFIKARFLVYGMQARLMSERRIGVSCHMKWIDELTLEVETWMETEYSLMELLLSLGASAQLLEPEKYREELANQCRQMLAYYTEQKNI